MYPCEYYGCIKAQGREEIMWWERFFWVVYGVGSTLFVFFLFKLGNTVASNREERIKHETERPQRPGRIPPAGVRGGTRLSPDHAGRAPVGRVSGVGEANRGEAVASVDATNEFLMTTGGFQADASVRRQTDQGRSFP